MMENKVKITDAFKKIGIELSQVQVDQFYDYYKLLIEWNEKMNLTAITDFDEVLLKHFVDSATAIFVYDFKKDEKVLDLGTGAGFPGIPLKILFPETEFVLMDSLNKRIRFLDEVVGKLQLTSITAVHGRAEEMARKKEYREVFDLCVSRAVANTSTLLEYCTPFVHLNGHFIAYKSEKFKEEILTAENAMKVLHVRMALQKDFDLADTDMHRTLVLFEKIGHTTSKFPRKAGLPSKEPIA